jgi:hypothetical protein
MQAKIAQSARTAIDPDLASVASRLDTGAIMRDRDFKQSPGGAFIPAGVPTSVVAIFGLVVKGSGQFMVTTTASEAVAGAGFAEAILVLRSQRNAGGFISGPSSLMSGQPAGPATGSCSALITPGGVQVGDTIDFDVEITPIGGTLTNGAGNVQLTAIELP